MTAASNTTAITTQEAPLPQGDRVTHYVSKFVLFLRATGVMKDSNSKSDLQGNWQWCPSLGHV